MDKTETVAKLLALSQEERALKERLIALREERADTLRLYAENFITYVGTEYPARGKTMRVTRMSADWNVQTVWRANHKPAYAELIVYQHAAPLKKDGTTWTARGVQRRHITSWFAMDGSELASQDDAWKLAHSIEDAHTQATA